MAAEPFPYSTMVELLHYWSSHDAHRPAFIFYDKYKRRHELTRGQLYQLGGRWAAVLQEGEVRRKERVVSTLLNGPERALCDVGIVMAGAVVVNAQCQLADGSDLLFILRQSKACAVCVNPDLDFGPWRVLTQHINHDPATNTVSSATLPHLRKVFFIRRTAPLSDTHAQVSKSKTGNPEVRSSDADKQLRPKDVFGTPETGDFIASLQDMDKFYKAEVTGDETVIVFTTSGSTGFSKLVPHTHAALVKYFALITSLGSGGFSVAFSCSPLGWAGGITFKYLGQGKCRLLLDMWYGTPDDLADVVWHAIVQEGCYEGMVMPFLLPKLVALQASTPWKMKSVLLGGQPMKKATLADALRLSDKVVMAYGSTELHLISSMSLTDASQYRDFLVGKPPPGSTVKVCDQEGNEVLRGNRGEIYAKTDWMTKGYLIKAEDIASSFTADGFLKTGDIGVMLEDGSLLVEGRHQDAVHRGNYIFYPAWLESRIVGCCPGLQNVFVVGVPDPAMGEELCACFVPSDPSVTEERVRSLVEEDILTKVADFLSPRPRYYLRFQAFPKTYTDKPLRKDMRRQAIERLNLA